MFKFHPQYLACKKTTPEKLTDILPKDNKGVMLIFPFDCQGKLLDALSNELLIYGCPAFRVRDNSVFLSKIKDDTPEDHARKYQKVHIFKDQYMDMKRDNADKYWRWLSMDDIGLALQWFLCDSGSLLSNSVEIIRSEFNNSIVNLYDAMIKKEEKTT